MSSPMSVVTFSDTKVKLEGDAVSGGRGRAPRNFSGMPGLSLLPLLFFFFFFFFCKEEREGRNGERGGKEEKRGGG